MNMLVWFIMLPIDGLGWLAVGLDEYVGLVYDISRWMHRLDLAHVSMNALVCFIVSPINGLVWLAVGLDGCVALG